MNRRAFLAASAATMAMGWRDGRSGGRAAAGSIAGDALSRCPHRERLEATTTSFGEFSRLPLYNQGAAQSQYFEHRSQPLSGS